MHIRATKHFHMVFSTPKGKKRNKTIYTGKLPQVKEEREIFLGFHLITTTSMEIKLTNFFGFLKVYQTHRKKARKINKTNMDNTMKEYEHRRLE